MFLAYKPSACAILLNAAVLYHPGEAVFSGCGSFSKKTPTVAAPEPKALLMREASPKPVEAPITSTLFGPLIFPFDFTYPICFNTFCSHPTG